MKENKFRKHSFANLTKEVRRILDVPQTESARFEAMDLCEVLSSHPMVQADSTLRLSVNKWIGRIQKYHNIG